MIRVRKGVSLVELIIGVALLVTIMLGAFLSLRSIGQGRGGVSMNAKVNNKLRTVAEQIRYEAGSRFDSAWDTTPSEDRTENFDTNITIQATYGAISPSTRSRTVTLVASWKDGSGQTQQKTMRFEVTRVQNKMLGATIVGRIVKEGTWPPEGLGGVEVQAQSMEAGAWVPPIPRVTNSDGYFEPIAGAYVGAAPGARLKIDGSRVLAYHPHADKNQRKFMRDNLDVNSETKVGVTNNYRVNNPIAMVATGKVVGYVKDGENGGVGIGNVEVKLLARENNLSLPDSYYTRSAEDSSTTTVSSGRYEFNRVVPGDYFVAVVGNDQYAGLAGESDYFKELGNPDFFPVASNEQVIRPDALTTRRGSLSGSVFFTTWNSGTSVLESDSGVYKSTTSVRFDIYRTATQGYHQPNKLASYWDWGNTNSWQLKWKGAAAEVAVNAVAGDFTLPNYMPIILQRNTASYSASGQFAKVRMEPGDPYTPWPFTAVRVVPNSLPATWPLALANVRFLHVNSNNDKLVAPAHNETTLAAVTDQRVYANTNTTTKVHLLHRNTFGRLTGDIRYSTSGNPYVLNADSVGTVKTRWNGSNGWGGLQTSGSSSRLVQNLGVTSVLDTTANTHTFSFPLNTLPPNLPGNTTVLDFLKTNSTMVTKTFMGVVEGVRKVLQADNSIQWLNVPTDEMDLTVNMVGYQFNSWNVRWNQPTFVIQNGVFDSGNSHSVYRDQTYSGSSQVNPVAVPFGGSASTTIWITSATAYERIHLRVLSSVDNRWGFNWNRGGTLTYGPLFAYKSGTDQYELDTAYSAQNTPLSVFRRIRTKVNGRAVDASTGAGIDNAQIYMVDRDGGGWTVQTNPDGTFSFDYRYITPYSNWNIAVRFNSHVNYNTSDWIYREVYEASGSSDLIINLPNFSMPKKPTGGGNQGGGGQQGSG